MDGAASGPVVEVALLTGGEDPHYAVGLAVALAAENVRLEVVGSDEIDCPALHGDPRLTFLNLRGDRSREAALASKISRLARYYLRLLRYAALSQPRVLHILWNNRFQLFDRTVLTAYYRCCGKRVLLTAHNVNAARRDARDSRLNRLSLRVQYSLCDRIFVHTRRMGSELIAEFGVQPDRICLIPYGINNVVPNTAMTSSAARLRLKLEPHHKVVLFFGNIAPYKGLEFLVDAMQRLWRSDPDFRLVIAGRPKKGAERYWHGIHQALEQSPDRARVIERIQHIPDEEAELYFKAADVLALPYTEIYQSGVLFCGYSFGLPAVAADVGSLSEDVVEGSTGYLCPPRDPDALAEALRRYFSSELYRHLETSRPRIREHVTRRHSWTTVAAITRQAYVDVQGAI